MILYYQQVINMSEEEQMGQLALVLGDFHIPLRCAQVSIKYKEMITPNKVSAVFCTGNIGSRESFDWVKSLSSTFYVVKGDYEDEALTDFPQQKVFQFAGVKIGMIHGHQIIPWADEQALQNKAKQMGVNLLITGHSHDLKSFNHNGIYFINPGSITGAYSALKINAVPSFMILQFKSTDIVIYEYSLVDGELKCVDGKIPRV